MSKPSNKVSIGISGRVRPNLPWESENDCIKINAKERLIGIQNNKDKENCDFYKFNKETFGKKEKNNDVFDRLGKPLCDNVLNGKGYNSLLITYGQTGSGKTHTLFGSEENDEGVLPKMIKYLRENCDSVSLSAIECYGIRQTKVSFFDLLNKKQTGSKEWSKKTKTSCEDNGVSCIELSDDPNDPKSAKNLIKLAMENGHFAETAKNPHSSRGHILFMATVCKDMAFHCVMVLDLAGSEGISALPKAFEKKVGMDDYKQRLMEAGIINNGLGALQKMLKEVSSKRGLSNVRGDGIRRLLHPFLMKKCNPMIDILFTFSPSITNLDSSRNTFRVSKVIGHLKIIPKKQKQKQQRASIVMQEKDAMIEKLMNDLEEKDLLIHELRSELELIQNGLEHAEDFIFHNQRDDDLESIDEESVVSVCEPIANLAVCNKPNANVAAYDNVSRKQSVQELINFWSSDGKNDKQKKGN